MIGSSIFWNFVTLICSGILCGVCNGKTFTVAYLTGSERRPGNMDYHRPGLSISGAITLAVQEINNLHPLVDGHKLNFTIAETYGDEEESILQLSFVDEKEIAGYLITQLIGRISLYKHHDTKMLKPTYETGILNGITLPLGILNGITLPLGILKGITLPLGILKEITIPLGILKEITLLLGILNGITLPLGILNGITLPLGILKGITIPLGILKGITLPLGILYQDPKIRNPYL
ncbi:hypothetical protein HNY73_021606 [Argiope bruennichi]|uniref:Uncharacterized protein n=1 Tax=Argiope bruennichi TaxID=94029 RepID=A0A8T0DZN2_ARGBR|nr:hypothetical protein HNY73_021606 [Argiope bruennichi]